MGEAVKQATMVLVPPSLQKQTAKVNFLMTNSSTYIRHSPPWLSRCFAINNTLQSRIIYWD